MDKMILERAQNAVIARDFGLAARLYKTLLKEEPDNITILRALGGLYEKSGEDEKAIPYYENILTFDAHDVDAMNSIGGIYRRLKQHEKAIEILNRALEENKKTAMVNYTLGFTYKDMGNYDDAIDCFESVVSENPSDVLAYNHLGVIYTIKSDYTKAIHAFQRGLQTDPNHPILHYNLGRAFEAQKNYSEAIRCYELALKAKPGWVDAMHDLVNLLLVLQKTQRAYDVVQKSLQLHPTNADLTAMFGKVCIGRFDFEGAEEAYEKADSFKPGDVKIMIGKAEAYEKVSRIEEASLLAKQAYQIGIKDFADRKRYVHIMLGAGEFKRADDEIKKLISEFPMDVSPLDLKAQYLICAGNEDGAIDVLKEIKDLNPFYTHHNLEAARRFCQMGKYEKAIEYAEKYVAVRPNNPAVFNLLGKIYELSGDYEMGVWQLKKGCSLNVENVYGKQEIERLLAKYNDSLHDGVVDYINDLNSQKHEEEAEPEEEPIPPLVEEEQPEEEESFDFDQMGGDLPPEEESEETDEEDDETPDTSIPLLAELSEDEGLNAFDDILNNTDDVLENEKEEKKEEELEFDPEEKSNPYERFIPDSSLNSSEPVASEETQSEPVIPPAPEPVATPPQPAPQNLDSQLNSQIADKLDNAVRQMEKTVDSVAKMAEEKAQEAMQKAEDAIKKVEEAVNKIPPEPAFSEPMFTPPPRQVPQYEDVHAEPRFAEPNFNAPFETKDPFGSPIPGLSAADMIAANKTSEAINSATEFLPNIVKMLEDRDMAKKYESELGLFQKLRTLSDHLPPEQKDAFLSSKTRMLMDYAIAKMSGSPGLMTTGKNLLNSGILDSEVDYEAIEKEAESLSGDQLVCKVISDLKVLTAGLEDQGLAKALRNEADKILAKL